VDVMGLDGRAVRVLVPARALPGRAEWCVNRPLAAGPTWYPQGYGFWSSNDPGDYPQETIRVDPRWVRPGAAW
jgi:hypothetical protein